MAMKFTSLPDIPTATALFERICESDSQVAPHPVNKPLVLYGAGNLGKMAKKYFDRIGVPILLVVDANAAAYRADPFWEGLSVMSPEDVSGEISETSLVAVCVATTPYIPLATFLQSSGWTDVVPFYDICEAYRNIHPLSNGWFCGTLGTDERRGIMRVLEGWDDNISRAHHLQILAWRALREEWRFDEAPVTIDDRYFIPLVKELLSQSESFLDVGAHHGETIIRFLNEVKFSFSQAWAIEPDQDNLFIFQQKISALPTQTHKNIHVLPVAMASWEGEGLFCEGLGYASQLSELGQNTVEVCRIDDLGIAPSYIKLHLEGAELDVLKGATETLHQSRPIVAATSYHNELGLSALPLWLMETLENYRFFLRLHSWCGTGSVVYALPQERCDVHNRQGHLL